VERRTLRPRKSLGQHFLRDENIVRKIIAVVHPAPGDVILEIGPGEGALTRHLAGIPREFLAVDIDRRVIEQLEVEFTDRGVQLIHADFLEVDLQTLARTHGSRLRIIGNIPYNITSPILFHVLDNRSAVIDATMMMQREVARRLVATPGSKEYGILSVMCGMFAEPRLLFDVSPNSFRPKPDVVSSVVSLVMREHPAAHLEDESFFREMVRAVFGKRRKTLRNSLKYFLEDRELPDMHGVDLRQRPEALSLQQLAELSNLLYTALNRG
jgi:16S rRNA (adenine1518-N6/adenine1519-N6)-dimethyltransferase